MPTSVNKTFCYTDTALISKGLTVVFSPLKALIDGQIIEMIQIGILCASLYTSSDQPRHFQECVFTEIAAGILKCFILHQKN
ncbi:7478_t:CDS:2 [Gigaspora margarita]|uniref:7478_t:CDS:1 n=1 Tax=Gigaspora margarita TaxID=4874 RepID=A0ABN7UQ88_GIGMA|nr:7478_t:CDS:2 [Gigaspora margarita]